MITDDSGVDKVGAKAKEPGDSGSEGAIESGPSRLRISKVLKDLKGKGSYSKLEKSMAEVIRKSEGGANDSDGAPRPIERRKLKAIVDNDPKLVLSLAELRGLDIYLEQFGHGLAVKPLFEKPELLREIAKSHHAVFLLGSKRDPTDDFRINISHWDVLGLSSIQAGVQGYEENLLLDIREIRMHDRIDLTRNDRDDAKRLGIYSDRGPSLISLASIRTNQMTERILCAMAGLEEYQDSPPGSPLDLPFHFVWPPDPEHIMPSRFHLHGEDALRENAEAGEAVLNRNVPCFRYQGRYLIDELTTSGANPGKTYALCAAQRREDEQVWLVVAGLTGPATYAAARWVHKMPTRFDQGSRLGRSSRVFWNLLSAVATPIAEAKGGTYHVAEAEVVGSGIGFDPLG